MNNGASRARLVTPADAAEQLGISLRTIYELMSTGALASIKIPPGGKTSPRRIEQAEIDAFIERNRVKVTAVPKAQGRGASGGQGENALDHEFPLSFVRWTVRQQPRRAL